MSNTVGAASFWKDYDAQTRYKHLSGQKEQSFRALTDAQRAAQPRDEFCPTLLQALDVSNGPRPSALGRRPMCGSMWRRSIRPRPWRRSEQVACFGKPARCWSN